VKRVDATTVISQIFTGTVSGMMLVLMALGLTLIFGTMNVVNFAHGALYMVGAYFLFFTLQKVGNFWVALLLVPVMVGVVGILIERVLMRPLYSRPEEDPILMTFGLTYIFMEGMRMYFGKFGLVVDTPPVLSHAVNLGLFYFPAYMIFAVVCAMLAIFGLWLFQEKTDIGLIVRAGSRDSVMVRVLGLDFNRVRLLSFSIGTALAGLAGALSAPIRGVIPEMGAPVLPQAFVVVVVGGKGSFWGTVASGLLVGLVTAVTSLWYPSWAEVVVYFLMAVILLVRPMGLFGRE
jgi:branched-chain amino acid transport system permease protein